MIDGSTDTPVLQGQPSPDTT